MSVRDTLQKILDYSLIRLGEVDLTVGSVTLLIGGLILVGLLSGWLQRWVAGSLLARTRLDLGAREAAGSIARYAFSLVGFLVILQTAGIDLSALTVVAGAVGLGIGFGLQTIANNFISGLVIMFERPIKVGDRIEVGGVHGRVSDIRTRATTVLTNDNISVIVPNSMFISENVVNWTHSGQEVRFRISVSVAYDSDARQVEELLIAAARDTPDVLETPAPAVRLMNFGADGLEFELRVWSSALVDRPGKLRSDVRFRVLDQLRAAGIEIPYPQRDLHLRTGFENRPGDSVSEA